MIKPKPPCQTLYPWLRSNLGKNCLGVLTQTDARALEASVHIVRCYLHSDYRKPLAQAYAAVVNTMQTQSQCLAFHAIAHVWDWDYRFELWAHAELQHHGSPGKCAFERGGSGIEFQP